MKKKHLFLAVLAIVLVLSMSIGATMAYFTTYARANGGYVIHLGYWTVINEDVEGNIKKIQISNVADPDTDDGLYPIFVRAQMYAGNDVVATFQGTSPPGSSPRWVPDPDGYYYYTAALYTGDTSEELDFAVTPAANAGVRPGDPIDVLITFQSVPAVFTTGGDPDIAKAWSNQAEIRVING